MFKKIDILNKEQLLSHIKMDSDKYNMIKDIYDPHFINNFYDFDTFYDIYTKIKPDYSKYKDIIYQKIELEGAASGTAQTQMPDTSFMRKPNIVTQGAQLAPLVAPRQQQVAPLVAQVAPAVPQVTARQPQVAPQVVSLVAARQQQVAPQVTARQQQLAPLVAQRQPQTTRKRSDAISQQQQLQQ